MVNSQGQPLVHQSKLMELPVVVAMEYRELLRPDSSRIRGEILQF